MPATPGECLPRIITVAPRTPDARCYGEDLDALTRWSDEIGCSGMLLFTGTHTPIDPWVAAQRIVAQSRQLEPVIAVNPAYMHPAGVARILSSIAHLYQRRLHLNLIAGTSLGELESIGDTTPHDERYQRLGEYVDILRLLMSGNRPVSMTGRHYRINDLQLFPPLAPDHAPGFFIAGHSRPAADLAARIGAQRMCMLPPGAAHDAAPGSALHFGVVTAPSWDAARHAAISLFPDDEDGLEIVEASMGNTDARWKQSLHHEAGQQQETAHSAPSTPGVWLHPFRMGRADCPYLVGSQAEVADILLQLVRRGHSTLVVETPVHERELTALAGAIEHVRHALVS
ncbi:LLM class flavin-dependent oxidoreductase [Burkholderia gladioli]|uniref:LLM class flavin-dependent oxidoreductase n=1 Tax=Burkholderia gladioli TaxID=28095 RepID=UPI0016412CE6|nr:LLM class flavin-dependent oxidoreductase [Burkholderia gladioli]